MNEQRFPTTSASDASEHSRQAPHGHQADLQDGLDFVNTLELERGDPVDRLASPATALHWLREHGFLHDQTMERLATQFADDEEVGQRALGRIRRVRGAMREVLDATVERRPPDGQALERVNRALRTPYTYELVPAPDGVSLDHRHDGDPIDGALARLAESVAREVSQGEPERLRICANEECRWVFNDTSPTGRRKWCDMSTCGNRAKAARHRERRKSETADPPDGVAAAG